MKNKILIYIIATYSLASIFPWWIIVFVGTLIGFLSKTSKELNIISDQKGVPTSSLELSRNLIKIIEKLKNNNDFHSNIYHFSQNGKVISFYEFANFIFDFMKLKNYKIPLIQPILSRNYSKKSIRPLFSALDNSKLSKAFDLEIEKWEISLTKILNLIFTKK